MRRGKQRQAGQMARQVQSRPNKAIHVIKTQFKHARGKARERKRKNSKKRNISNPFRVHERASWRGRERQLQGVQEKARQGR
jgi:hypothetical protein